MRNFSPSTVSEEKIVKVSEILQFMPEPEKIELIQEKWIEVLQIKDTACDME